MQGIKTEDKESGTKRLNVSNKNNTSGNIRSSADGKSPKIISNKTGEKTAQTNYKRLSPTSDRTAPSNGGKDSVGEIRNLSPTGVRQSQSNKKTDGTRKQDESKQTVRQTEKAVVENIESTYSTYNAEPDEGEEGAEGEEEEEEEDKPVSRRMLYMPYMMDSQKDKALRPRGRYIPEEDYSAFKEDEEYLGGTRGDKHQKSSNLKVFIQNNGMLLWIIMILLVAAVLFYFVYFRLMNKPEPETGEEPRLIMDDDTRERIVMRLDDKGWTADQIAEELQLQQKQVKQIISQNKA
ncbi:MAG: hypothetical protein GX294_02795 [Candidatus Cloacimonetes bacterium]|nr:hypothetical protein [Candidatus Cloacimonadota bacterium]